MSSADARLAQIANRHGGAFHTDHARASGMTADMLHDRRRDGVIAAMHPNVDRFTAAPFTHDTRLHGALLACGPDSFLSHRSAATILGFPGISRWRPEVTTPHVDLPRIEGITRHRTRHFRPAEVITVRGMRVASPGRTALGRCEVLPYRRAEEAITAAVVCKVLSVANLLAGIEIGGGRGVTGTVACRAIAAGAVDLEKLQSLLELAVSRVLDAARVHRGVPQYELTCADGRAVRLDWYWPEHRVAVEADGLRWHATPARLRKSQARSRSIQGSGITHLVFGWYDAHAGADAMRREVEWHLGEGRRAA
jgi:hypothetical protein